MGDLDRVLRLADSLHLSEIQVGKIAGFRLRYVEVRDSVYSELAAYLAARDGKYDGADVRDRWHDAIVTSVRARYEAAMRARDALTPGQVAWLRQRGLASALDVSTSWLERTTRGPQYLPR